MNEPAMTFDGVVLSPQKEVVRVFFKEMWDKADKSLIPKIFHPDFTFRASLGSVLSGYEQFTDYYDSVIGAIGEFTSDILEMVEEGNKVCCKLRYQGFPRRISRISADRSACVVVWHSHYFLRRRQDARLLGARRHPWTTGKTREEPSRRRVGRYTQLLA